MKLTTKLTIKLFLIISLFVSVGFADDGHMPSGGFTGNGSEVICDDGHMPSGGLVCVENNKADGHSILDRENNEADGHSILDIVQNYLFSLFG